MDLMKIGELAHRTGLSGRTLRYYEQVGLLGTPRRAPSGHRLYGPEALVRLQQIMSMRQLGLSLDEVRGCLDEPAFALKPLVALHVERVRTQLEHQQQLLQRLLALAARLEHDDEVPVTHILETMEAIHMLDTILTREQQEGVQRRRDAYKQAHGHDFIEDIRATIAELRAHMEAGTPADSPAVHLTLGRWYTLHEVNTGGDPQVAMAFKLGLRQTPELRERAGLDDQLMKYMEQAFQREADTLYHGYLTPEQVAAANARREAYEREHGTVFHDDWGQVLAELSRLQAAGADPAGEEAQRVFARFMALNEVSSGNDPAVREAVATMLVDRPELRRRLNLTDAVLGFLKQLGAAKSA